MTSSRMPAARMPAARMPAARMPAARMPAARMPPARMPLARMTSSRMPAARMPPARMPLARMPLEPMPLIVLQSDSSWIACLQCKPAYPGVTFYYGTASRIAARFPPTFPHNPSTQILTYRPCIVEPLNTTTISLGATTWSLSP